MELLLRINNEIYDLKGHGWWEEDGDGNLVSLRFLTNPVKSAYILENIGHRPAVDPRGRRVLDVGCGGGYLSEELAGAGLEVTGIDLSHRSIQAARNHAQSQGLRIEYLPAAAEALPFAEASFDFICCCDVLEHVPDPDVVIREISRVLKTGGLFFYDTINRTVFSWVTMIKILQDWKSTAILDKNVHCWNMFLKPRELVGIMGRHHLKNLETKGLSPSWNLPGHYLNLRRRVGGRISWMELGRRLKIGLTDNQNASYLGQAVKTGPGISR